MMPMGAYCSCPCRRREEPADEDVGVPVSALREEPADEDVGVPAPGYPHIIRSPLRGMHRRVHTPSQRGGRVWRQFFATPNEDELNQAAEQLSRR